MSALPSMPFDQDYYADLTAARSTWALDTRHEVAPGRGFGCRVQAGQVATLVMLEGAQIIDLDIFAAEDAGEYLHVPTQLRIEGGRVDELTRLWGTPPRTRPLATVVENRLRDADRSGLLRDHKSYGAHCNPHQWLVFAGFAPNTCYDNLTEGCRMVGFGPGQIHDNLNLYMKSALEPGTGKHLNVVSDAQAGDSISFFAETDIFLVMSLCPYGDGSVVPEDFGSIAIPTSPIAVEIADTGSTPLGWPYRDADVAAA